MDGKYDEIHDRNVTAVQSGRISIEKKNKIFYPHRDGTIPDIPYANQTYLMGMNCFWGEIKNSVSKHFCQMKFKSLRIYMEDELIEKFYVLY